MNQNAYLGEEKVGKLLVKFSVPCILSLVISCLYNVVDQIFVGHGVGALANAATGVIFPITVIGWGISLFFGDGAAAFLSISLGKNQPEKIHKCVGNAILGSFLGGAVLIAVAYIWGDNLLMLLGGTSANIGYAHAYGVIIYSMIPVALVENCLAAVIRADGAPRYAMIGMIAGAVVNMIGDPVAIFALHMGIAGAAWATIIGQLVSLIIFALYLPKSKNFRLKLNSFIPDGKILGGIMRLGASSFLTQICIVVTTVVNNVLFVKYGYMWNAEYGGDAALAAFVVIMKLFQIVINVAIGIAAGAQPVVGYNYGAEKYSRVRKLYAIMLAATAGICAIWTALFELFPSAFIAMFGGAKGSAEFNDVYLRFAVPCFRIYLSLITFGCLQKVTAIFMQSLGLASLAAPLSFLRDLLLIIFACLLPLKLGVMGVVWAAPLADLSSFILTLPFALRVYRKTLKPLK